MRDANKAKTQPPQEGDEFNKGAQLLGSTVSLAGDLNGDKQRSASRRGLQLALFQPCPKGYRKLGNLGPPFR